MSGLMRQFSEVTGQPGIGELTSGITGQAGAEAALEASQRQAALGREALGVTRGTQARLEETLQPFVQAGLDIRPEIARLFGPEAAQVIQQDPAFQELLRRQQQQTLQQQAARGRVAAGETPEMLQRGATQLGSQFLSQQRTQALGGLGLGQASAAQQGFGSLTTGSRSADLLTQIANARAAGGIGAQQALGQGTQNVAGIAGLLTNIFSDRRLKRNISKVGKWRGYNTYKYQYKNSDEWYVGVMSDEVKERNPGAVTDVGGYDLVNYEAL